MLTFDNRFRRELPGDPEHRNYTRQVHGACWSAVAPQPVAEPRLLALSAEMAATLGLREMDVRSSPLLEALAGNSLLPGMEPYATCYGGHQFGHWAGQLGDGRAIYLGEALAPDGSRWEMQLKGAGPTPYSRRADGRAVLRSSLREFLCSEAMFHLGIPTTRALSLVATGDTVVRDMFYDGHPNAEPGAVVCRVAPSFTRFGHFEILASRGETELLADLVDFTLDRDFAGCALPPATAPTAERLGAWFTEISRRTARLVAEWMRVGFVHGVMNTDNMSILGLTIDYGPYGWIDNFDPAWTPNTTDAQGRRYCFGRQAEIARWNLHRLAEALCTLPPADDALANALGAGLAAFDDAYFDAITGVYAGKFGLPDWRGADDAELVNDAFRLLQTAELDMTDFFRRLATLDPDQPAASQLPQLAGAAYSEHLWQRQQNALAAWLDRYFLRLSHDPRPQPERQAAMNRVNPRFIPRNYLAQQAIDRAAEGDTHLLDELLDTLRRPYDEQPERAHFAALRPDWARHKPGCSMLSCSS
jgi:uncharacterized protein YdiU (UPF0061 family)